MYVSIKQTSKFSVNFFSLNLVYEKLNTSSYNLVAKKKILYFKFSTKINIVRNIKQDKPI
jgi:chemotaxis methyl-accepting protein methylase